MNGHYLNHRNNSTVAIKRRKLISVWETDVSGQKRPTYAAIPVQIGLCCRDTSKLAVGVSRHFPGGTRHRVKTLISETSGIGHADRTWHAKWTTQMYGKITRTDSGLKRSNKYKLYSRTIQLGASLTKGLFSARCTPPPWKKGWRRLKIESE